MKRYWFKAKHYGWGWQPATWQGWLVMLVWIVAFTSVFVGVNSYAYSTGDMLTYFLPRVLVLTWLLFWVCWKTGEPPRWRWAGRQSTPVFVLGWTLGLLAAFIGLAFALVSLFAHLR